MTSVRTMWGIDLSKIGKEFGKDFLDNVQSSLTEFRDKGWIALTDNTAVLTTEGKLFADHIAAELFFEHE